MSEKNLKGIREDLKQHEIRDEKWEEGINSKLKKLLTLESNEHEKKAANRYVREALKKLQGAASVPNKFLAQVKSRMKTRGNTAINKDRMLKSQKKTGDIIEDIKSKLGKMDNDK